MAVTKKGGRWYVVLYLGRPKGKVKTKWLPGSYPTKGQARQAEVEATHKLNTGQWVEPSKLTFGDYLVNDWLPRIVQPSVEFSTFDSYRRNIEKHVIPRLGEIQLRKLSPDHLIDLYAELRAKPLRSKTVHYIHTIIHKALADAFDRDKVERNVAAKRTVKPKIKKQDSRKKVAWTDEHLRIFLESCNEHRFYLAWLLGMLTGLRRGEVLGLKWSAVDLDGAKARIEHQLTVVANRVIPKDSPKTEGSAATVPLASAMVALLTAHQTQEKEKKLALGIGPLEDSDYIFTDQKFRSIHPETFSQAFERAVSQAGLSKIPLHGLRRTYISLSSASGTPMKIVQANARHSSITTTMDEYAMPYEDMQREAHERLAKLILGSASGVDRRRKRAT